MEQPVAVITGAGRGIGRAVAVQLAKRHYRLALVARTAADLEQTRSLAGNGQVIAADVSQAPDVQRAVALTIERLGRIDALVHCAGVAPVRSIVEMTEGEWHQALDTNLSAAFFLLKAAWPVFARQGGGVMVNVSSLAARDPFDGFAAYGAAKAGLNLFGLAAAREGARIGLRVHTVAPGAVETAMFRRILSQEQYPADKTLRPDDVARVICQCVSGDLQYTSGEVIHLHKTT